jgi:hypothetical protein
MLSREAIMPQKSTTYKTHCFSRVVQRPVIARRLWVDARPIGLCSLFSFKKISSGPPLFAHVVISCWLALAHARLAQTSLQNFKHS